MKTTDFYAEFKKLINLPPRIVALDLRLRMDETPRVTITYFPEVNSAAQVTRHFDIVEALEKPPATAPLLSTPKAGE